MDQRNACLVLRTSDLTAGSTTNIGSMDTVRKSMTWFNIDLRMVLGDLYDMYDYFNLSLYYIATDTSSTLSTAGDRAVNIEISGLPFTNQTYNQVTRSNSIWAPLAPFPFANNASVQQNFYGSNIMTFAKNQELVNISIQYTKLSDDLPYTGAQLYPQTTFIFHIFGIPKDNNNSRRLVV